MKFKKGDLIKIIKSGIYPGRHAARVGEFGVVLSVSNTGDLPYDIVMDISGLRWFVNEDEIDFVEEKPVLVEKGLCSDYMALTPRERVTFIGELVHLAQSDIEYFGKFYQHIHDAKRDGLFDSVTINPTSDEG